MKFYLAPMEEVTGYVFRKVYAELFGCVDRYFTPFLTPAAKRALRKKEEREVDPANNPGVDLVPQLLANDSRLFLQGAMALYRLGYPEVNLNLGCPSKTVVPKRRGSGFLADPQELDDFFREVFEGRDVPAEGEDPGVKPRISVKTRLGLSSPEEFGPILEIYNRYPLSEVILHPRVQSDFYDNRPDLEAFEFALTASRHPLCYNGDIRTREDFEKLTERFPALGAVMIGRGLVANPGLVREIRTGQKVTLEELAEYERRLYEGYVEAFGGPHNALFKMKEVWYYLGDSFADADRERKRIRKAQTGEKYREAVDDLFRTGKLVV